MANVMSLKSFSNNVKRNGFDLSFKNAFTAKAGELLPVMVKEVIPGDKFKVSGQSFTRTQPLNSAAYVRMREYYDFFFVPYRLLWNRAPTFFTNMKDFHHAAGINQSGDVTDQHPYFTINDIRSYLTRFDDAESLVKSNFQGFMRKDLSVKLLDYLGYGSWVNPANTALSQDYVLNPFPLLAYQKVYQDFFRDDQWENAAPYCYNLDYITQANAGTSLHIPVSGIDINSLTMFDLRYCNWSKDYFMGMLPSSQFGEEAFVPLGGSGGSAVSLDGYMIDGMPNPSGNLETVRQNAPYSSAAPDNLVNAYQPAVEDPQAVLLYQNAEAGHDYRPRIPASEVQKIMGTSISSNLSILALRQAEALQKWKEIAQSGKQDYRTQMQKHFGVTPSEAMGDHCRYLGGWTTNIDVSEVVNSTLTDDTQQADIRGKGVGTGSGSIDFDANEHGILICIYHNMPLLDYAVNGCKRLNMKSHFTDYAIPEFDSIGMQQLYPEEFGISNADAGDDALQMGYVPRYADYKTSYDEIHGAFNDSLESWVAPLTYDWWSQYLIRVSQVFKENRLTYDFFKVNPMILDNLFGVNADSTVNTDQFLVNSFFDVKCVRNLDYNGLPY